MRTFDDFFSPLAKEILFLIRPQKSRECEEGFLPAQSNPDYTPVVYCFCGKRSKQVLINHVHPIDKLETIILVESHYELFYTLEVIQSCYFPNSKFI